MHTREISHDLHRLVSPLDNITRCALAQSEWTVITFLDLYEQHRHAILIGVFNYLPLSTLPGILISTASTMTMGLVVVIIVHETSLAVSVVIGIAYSGNVGVGVNFLK